MVKFQCVSDSSRFQQGATSGRFLSKYEYRCKSMSKLKNSPLRVLLVCSVDTITLPPSNVTSVPRSRHKLQHLWPLQSIVGLVGVILNSIVFYMFVSERQNMANSVNVLIWCGMSLQRQIILPLLQHNINFRMHTVYCFIYSAISMHWRSIIMYTRSPLFFNDLEVVGTFYKLGIMALGMCHSCHQHPTPTPYICLSQCLRYSP